MLSINIRTIPHHLQRYPTVGDWLIKEEGFKQDTIYVSDMEDSDYEFLVAIHELIEMHLAQKNGVDPSEVTKFDVQYEKNRDPRNTREPGDDPNCPVYREHKFATKIEKLIAKELKVNWKSYSSFVENL